MQEAVRLRASYLIRIEAAMRVREGDEVLLLAGPQKEGQ